MTLDPSTFWRVRFPVISYARTSAPDLACVQPSATYGGVNQVLQNSLVDLLQRPASGALLLHSRDTGGLAHHAALADEHDVSVRELLLELPSESGWGKGGMNEGDGGGEGEA